jgi:hypothetical protein
MNRRAELAAWGLVGLAFACLLAAPVVEISAGGKSLGDALGNVADIGLVFSICFPVLGAFVIRQRGSHAVGWLLCGIGVSIALHNLVDTWQSTAHDNPGSLPWGDFAHWVGTWLWFPGWVAVTTLLPTLFPDGRPTGRRRWLAWVDAAGIAAVTVAFAGVTWQLRGIYDESRNDPPSVAAVYVAGVLVVALLTFVSLGSLVARYRRADPILRRQIAWVVYGAAVAVVMSVIGAVPSVSSIFQVLEALAIVGGLAVAMFRYELYDIGVVVNRTLVYGALTATLAGVYLASVLLLQLVLSPSSDLAIAASTLAAAALFRPARSRIQRLVDRRFYRSRYDARQTLDSFAGRLRHQVDLDALGADLRGVVAEKMQPAHVSLWLRDPGRVT